MQSSKRYLWRLLSCTDSHICRPPWSLAEQGFTSACTRCNDCITRCPEQILVRGDGGFPQVDFSRGECTFCGECAGACTTGALQSEQAAQMSADAEPPWRLKAAVTADCMARQGIVCRTCEEQCEAGAISFSLRHSAVAQPQVDPAVCTGCGACVAPCPAQAITVTDSPQPPDSRQAPGEVPPVQEPAVAIQAVQKQAVQKQAVRQQA